MTLRKFAALFLLPVFAVGLFAATPALASAGCEQFDANDPLGADCVAASGLNNEDVRVVAGRLIQVALGLIGIIMVGLILYAGFTWMTAAGESDKIEKAKKTIFAAVVGLTIILMAYSITTFILGELYNATTGRIVY